MPEPQPEPVITWVTRPRAALEFTVNFGIFVGRHVAPRDLERLADALREVVEAASIAAEDRLEIGTRSGGAIHQVRVELETDALPDDEADVEKVRHRIAEVLNRWLMSCVSGVTGQDLTDAEVKARDAVVEGVFGERYPRPPP